MTYNSILITGGAGFVGSNLAVSLRMKYPDVRIIVLDNLKRRGSELNLSRFREKGIDFVHGDIRNPEDFHNIDFDVMLECSAEPSVLSGYDGNPLYVLNTNLTGTINCLEAVRTRKADIIFLSSSRVYPFNPINNIESYENESRFAWTENQDISGWSMNGISEQFQLSGPRSLYGASKLCSEFIFQEYAAMFDFRYVINRCGVIAGPWQFGKIDQGVFTLWMLAHYFKKELKYIGYGGHGKQVRDLFHVDDLFELIDLQLNMMEKISGRIYNVGGGIDCSLSLMETTSVCREITGNSIHIGRIPETRPADLRIYATDYDLVKEELSWVPKKTTKEILSDIYKWIGENEGSLMNLY